jgi:glycosyltransferase AglD
MYPIKKFTIILPVHNEEKILMKSVSNLISELEQENTSEWEIILVENGSIDRTWKICQKLVKSYPKYLSLHRSNGFGYGGAIKFGVELAKYDNVFIANVDFWDISFIKKAFVLLESCDIVVGSKTLIKSNDQRPIHRRLVTYFFNIFLRTVFNFPGTDTHGLKALKKQTILPIIQELYPLKELYDTQLVLRACKNEFIYTELPVSVKEIRPTRYSFLKRMYNLIHDLIVIFKYRYLWTPTLLQPTISD